ncbi:uncharacterized protein BJ212DRAFT_939003 [Suillus subaureus]|uniref:DUF6535 domain-containing protein n=1 Tax=Suillus subaureus TaxID=48587 RepID=A0A9P7JH82_9AGAM|nr:uncharacterized protein BJ212DRAFT_939003 [Suillus subaureus]KAG1822039.1 hypothetical protein BJ212DRAFT_939003 [Suillus subaureus]
MQPDPIDTTNVLLLKLIQNTSDSRSATQPTIILSSTGFSSSGLWVQALAYASLGLNLLAAYGAVMGKQWLGHYKTTRFDGGSNKDRCQQRHRKFQELETWRFENVLRSFPVLLQISLLLFGLSLGAMLWMQQRPISILVFAMTTFGGLCHAFVIMVSSIHPDGPFQTPVSLGIQAVRRHFRERAGFQHQDEDSVTSAMTWILETSRSPVVVRSVVELIPTMSELPNVDIVSLCTEVRDMFKACFDLHGIPILHDSALAYGKALIYFSSKHDDVRDMLHTTTQGWNLWERWRALYLPQALEQCRVFYRRMGNIHNPKSKLYLGLQADTHAALRMAVAAGVDDFARPNDDRLIWNGRFKFKPTPSGDEGDWLLSCAEHFYDNHDIDAAGDALLLFSHIQMESLPRIRDRIARLLNDSQSHRFLYIALRTVCRRATLQDLLPIFTEKGFQSFRQAISKAIRLMVQHEWSEGDNQAIYRLSQIQFLVFLVLPAPKVDDLAKYTDYCRALIRYMGEDQCNGLRRYTAQIVCNARQDLVEFTTALRADESLRNSVLPELCPTLITTIFTCCNDLRLERRGFIPYFRLAFTLAKSSDWHPYLIRNHRYIEKWITSTLTDSSLAQRLRNPTPRNQYSSTDVTSEEAHCLFYLAGISLRISPPKKAASCFSDAITMHLWDLMRGAWYIIESCPFDELYDVVESLPALVRGTKRHMPSNVSKIELKSLKELLTKTLDVLRQQKKVDKNIISTVADSKNGISKRLA